MPARDKPHKSARKHNRFVFIDFSFAVSRRVEEDGTTILSPSFDKDNPR